uniref:epidermal growth factor receptor substrate 15-like 1 n=1 Tax=Styela clava TaxID=7725 RepID=UPI0019394873|nr:epidermal growth factor receptor substrate 15-like 1 [Styela clava]
MAGVAWKIQGEEKKKFESIFDSLGPVGGKLGGDKVKPVLVNSKLPNDILGQVWELSDIDKDGCLDRDEFCVAMHLVYKALEHEPVPSILPQEIVPPSKRKPLLVGAVAVLPPLISSANAKTELPSTNIGLLQPAVTSTNSILNPVGVSTPVSTPQSNLYIKGVVPDIEYTRFFGIFSQKAGADSYIAGSEARDIFVQSGLPHQVLAQVWNLCDQQQLGKLTQDQFILAMHFISQKVKGIEVPTQLPPEVYASKTRDSGFGDSGSLSDGSSGVGDFSALRELDTLNREIEELRREKETLTGEIREKELVVRQRSNEVQDLQNTLDRASTSLSQLESDKAEAHTRIDELDQQQLKLDGMLADVRAKVQEETRTISSLQSQIKAQELANAQQEEEYNKIKSQLDSLKTEETQLQQTLQIGQQQLHNITKQVGDAENEIVKVKEQITSLTEQQKTVSSNIEQYDKAVSALKSETETTNGLGSDFDNSQSFFDNKDDPFKSSDPFGGSDNTFKSDPFADTSAFSTVVTQSGNTPSNISDAFGSTSTVDQNDPFGSSTGKPDTNDPFSSKDDPFASSSNAFQTPSFDNDPFGGSDPFSSSTSASSPKKSENTPAKQKDMFSVDFSDPNPSVSLFNDSENAISNASKDSSDDPWAAFGGPSVGDNTSNGADPFGKDSFVPNPSASFDAFGSSFVPEKNTNNSSKNITGMSEKAQMSWAAEQSKKEEERREKMRIQEQKDLEYAIKLSKEI